MGFSDRLLLSTSRRQILKGAAATAATSIVGVPSGHAATKTLTLIHESSFIKAYDAYFQNTLAPAYEKLTGIKINYELASVGSMQTRVTTIAETGHGADLTLNFFNWPFLYDEKYVDVSDIAEAVGKQQGGWYDSAKEACVVNGKWKAIPFGNVGQLMNWRMDWFKEVGFELGHGFGDNHGWLYPLLWSFGGHEVEPDGKTIVLDSDETARAVDFARKFFQQTMLEDCLGWTDVNNNKAWLSEQISCTNNAESILWVAKHDFPEIAKVTDQAQNPKGPKGRFHALNCWSHSIFTSTPDHEAAKTFLKWLTDKPQLGAWYAASETYYQPFLHGYDNAPMWNTEPRNIPYRDAMATAHLPGWPAPVSRAQSEVIAKYVVIDMFAKACSGTSTKDAIAAATKQLKQIYGQA